MNGMEGLYEFTYLLEIKCNIVKFIYLFGVLRCFQHCTGHIMTGSWKDRGNQYIQLVKVLYCKLSTNGKQLPAFLFKVGSGTKPRPQRWEARVLPLRQHGPVILSKTWLQSWNIWQKRSVTYSESIKIHFKALITDHNHPGHLLRWSNKILYRYLVRMARPVALAYQNCAILVKYYHNETL